MAGAIKYYYITAVWFEDNRNRQGITHVLLHVVDKDGVNTGTKVPKSTIIGMLQKEISVYTATWDYKKHWHKGAEVSTEVRNEITYLRTIPDTSVKDNLESLLSGYVIHNCTN